MNTSQSPQLHKYSVIENICITKLKKNDYETNDRTRKKRI